MRLRNLELKDAPLMLEWMHDLSVVEFMQADFASKSLDDCMQFIRSSSAESIHFAIVDDEDEYMGTVSLKHITMQEAEFAIAVRKAAMGKGFSFYAMKEMIRYGFEVLHLSHIYWCVNPENKRAIKFYDKNGYARAEHRFFAGGGTLQSRFRSIFGIKYQNQGEGLRTSKYLKQCLPVFS